MKLKHQDQDSLSRGEDDEVDPFSNNMFRKSLGSNFGKSKVNKV